MSGAVVAFDRDARGTCATCRFFSAGDPRRGMVNSSVGECRARSPDIRREVGDFELRVWPVVWPDDWCGEFSSRLPARGQGRP